MSKPVHFNDPVHGQIPIDPIALAVIEHRYFQRLRRIKALGFLDRVFPGAKHSRFEHSIGVYHVAGKFCEGLRLGTLSLQQGLAENNWNPGSEFMVLSKTELHAFLTEKRINQIRLAALLHDVGHGPFSHASEPLMPEKKRALLEENEVPEWLKAYFGNELESKVNHEDYSVILMYFILKDVESTGLINEDDIKGVISVKTGKNFTGDPKVKKDFQVLQRIVDGEFDSDRMDYLRRDSLFCGVPYGQFDMDRVFDGLCLVKKSDSIEIAIKRSSVGAFEDFLFARYQMHVQVYTHRVDVACNSSFKKISEGVPLPAKIDEYVKWDDESFIFLSPAAHQDRLRKTLLDRNLWKTVYESFEQDQAAAIVVCDRIRQEVGPNFVMQSPTDKPFRKDDLLKFQVITKDMTGRLFTQKLKAISDIIAHYNTSYFALRLSVAPEKVDQARAVLMGFQATFTKEGAASEVRKTELALKKARQNPKSGTAREKAANGSGTT